MNKFNLTSVFNNSRGFTLLEILIAITLLAFITIGVVSITDNAILTMDRTTEVNRNNLQIETAMSRFEWDFSQLYSPLYFSIPFNLNQLSQRGTGAAAGAMSPELQNYYEQLSQRFERNEHFVGVSKEGLPIPRFHAPEKSTFEFFTSSNRRKLENTKQSHFAWVRYSLTDQEIDKSKEPNPNIPQGLKNLTRYFIADDPYDDKRINIEDPRVKGAVLLENVEALEFQFWDYNRKKWESSLKSIPQGESILRGVKVILSWYDYSGNKRTAERIFRTNWPMVAPQDPAAIPPGMNTGATGTINGTNGANEAAGAAGGVTAGVPGGINGF
jgi:prepilin-type N-terminal cleavage/methylation domain-containing protein